MNRKHPILVLALSAIPAAGACMQALDSSGITGGPSPGNSVVSPSSGSSSSSSSGSSSSSSSSGGPSSGSSSSSSSSGGDGGGLPVCLGGNIIDPGQGPVYCNDQYGGNPVPALQTPGVEFADGGTSLNPCDLLEQESMDVRKQYCAGCHAPGGDPLAPFHTILEDNYANGGGMTTPDGGTTLFGTIRKNSAPPAPIIIPGDHANSYLYQRVAGNTMPPVTVTVRPNVSDIALLGAWIDNLTSCFNQLGGGGGGGDAGGDDGGGGSGDGGAD